MNGRKAAERALVELKRAGADRAVATTRVGEIKELNVEGGKLTLLRSTFDTSLGLKALIGDRKGTTSVNRLDEESVSAAAGNAAELALASEPDDANEIAATQAPAEFSCGIDEPDLDLMYQRLDEFLGYVKERYPDTILEQVILKFVSGETWFQNSNGVDFTTRSGHYDFGAMFSSKKDGKSSSFNYSGYTTDSLDEPLWQPGSVDELIRQSSEQLDAKPVDEKFVGEIIVTPDALMSFLGFLTGSISDFPLITGTSAFKDKLNGRIASEKLNLRSMPLSDRIVEKYFVTGDGYRCEDCTIVENGILKTFLLSLYGARKTGGKRALSSGGCYVVAPGTRRFEEMVKSIDRGILVCRFSGGHPGNNGDFSGIAKNSYYIQNGEITWPLSETMISANAVSMLMDIIEVSADTINFGSSILPWIQFGGITVSGK